MIGRPSACLWLSLFLLVGCSSSAPSSTNGADSGATVGSGGLGGSNDAKITPASGGAGTAGNGAAGFASGAGGADAQAGASGGRDGGGAGESIGDGSIGGPGIMGSLTFTRKVLHQFNYAEGIGTGDFNKDGKLDVLSGPFWWEGPDFDKRHQYFPPPPNNAYTDMTLGDWADYPYDVDGDGWVDSINVMRPGTPSYWYKNPGAGVVDAPIGAWVKNQFGTLVLEESAFSDITGEGKPALVGAIEGAFGWFDLAAKVPWTFNKIAPSRASNGDPWWHGIGTGDVVAGQADLLTENAWYSPPTGGARAGAWMPHAQVFVGTGPTGAEHPGTGQMFAYDVDGDGDSDVVTALDTHGYGVAWFEQTAPGVFVRHDIVGLPGANNAGGIPSFSQPHALYVADVDGDGLKDIITGKSFYAHPPGLGDPDASGAPVFYVFRLNRGTKGVTWEPHLVDSEVGLGRQFTATDLNGDGKTDIAVASKHGVFLFMQN
jgi:hypothetical protein